MDVKMKMKKEKTNNRLLPAVASQGGQDLSVLGLVKVMKSLSRGLLAFLEAEVSLIQENLLGLLNGQRNLSPVRVDSRRPRERQEKRKNNF